MPIFDLYLKRQTSLQQRTEGRGSTPPTAKGEETVTEGGPPAWTCSLPLRPRCTELVRQFACACWVFCCSVRIFLLWYRFRSFLLGSSTMPDEACSNVLSWSWSLQLALLPGRSLSARPVFWPKRCVSLHASVPLSRFWRKPLCCGQAWKGTDFSPLKGQQGWSR